MLFVSHAADRTGPPMFLLTLQRWLRARTDVQVATLFQLGGPLLDDFAALGPVEVLGDDLRADTPVVDASEHDLVYLNASWTVRSLPAIGGRRALVAHVHEMEDVWRFLLDDADRAALATETDRILVGCRAAARNLVERHGIDPDHVATVPYPTEPMPLDGPVAEARAAARRRLDLPADLPVLVGAGVFDWRKAPDLLLQVAWHLRRSGRPCGVVWVGDDGDRPAWCDWDDEARRLGLDEVARRVPSTPALAPTLVAGDCFVLPSREDTFPLVCLEAASVELPTVCFDDAGIVELVEARHGEEAGAHVPYPDVEAMAGAVAALLDDPARRQAAGRTARRRFEARHRPEVALPALLAELAPFLGGPARVGHRRPGPS